MDIEIEIDKEVFLPCYRHLHDDTGIDIDFVYGSRDSGKSRDTAQRLVLKCLSDDYFRHILARKTFNTIKDSQWQVIKDVVDDWKLNDFFTFTTNPLAITCSNGNKFIARGFDDPHKIKSIQNPSGAWVEEGNELSADDWIILITSLRSNKGKDQDRFYFQS
jgi:phage terminase large subunit